MRTTTKCIASLALLSAILLMIGEAGAAYDPAAGPISTTVNFSAATSGASGPYALTKSATNISVSRPSAPNFTYNAVFSGGVLKWAFLASDFLLVQETHTGTVNVKWRITQVDLRGTGPASTTTIINRNDFVTDTPNVQVLRNSDGMAIFTKTLLTDKTITDTYDLNIRRVDTGGMLCSAGSINRDTTTQINAEISSGNAVITIDSNGVTCPLPAPDLTVSPDPVDFGIVLNTSTPTASVTLSNPGDESLVINSIANSAHCQLLGFAPPVTLNAGDSPTYSLQLAPSGFTGNLSETLPINRTPAVGASTIRCAATVEAPEANVSASDTSIMFGRVEPGQTAVKPVTISSTGDLSLSLTLVSAPGAGSAFAITPAPMSETLSPATGSRTYQIQFSPTAEVTYGDSIVFTTNDPDTLTLTISMNGIGHIPRPDFDLDSSLPALSYGDLEIGYRFGKAVRFLNRGDASLTFQVEATGDTRYSFSQDIATPGVGVRGPQMFTIPATTFGGPPNELVLRVTFDAQGPVGGPYLGDLEISSINDGDPDRLLPMSGAVVQGKTLDVTLVLDRSGSMSELAPGDTKVGAVRMASHLFYQLLRADVGDRAALVQYNTVAQTLKARTTLTESVKADFINEVLDLSNLVPSGRTSIAAGLLEGFTHVDDPARDVRAVMIVSDGKENEPAPSGETLDTVVIPTGVVVHSLGIGRENNIDNARLQAIASRSGGMSAVTGDLATLDIFGVEKFFLQVATFLLGGTTALDPLYQISPGQEFETVVPLIEADREVTIALMFKQGVLPFQIESPTGALFPTGSPPAGFGEDATLTATGAIVRIKLPAGDPGAYVGDWRVTVRHEGFVVVGGSTQHTLAATREHKAVDVDNPVDYAVYVGLRSNLRLLGLLSPQPIYVGDPIQVTGFLTEEGVPVRNATVAAQVTRPNGSLAMVTMHDDGAHNDGAADDGEYGGLFTATNLAGGHSFRIHATGMSAHGRPFVRETSLGKAVIGRSVDDPGPGVIKELEDCCKRQLWWLRILALLLLLMVLCCYYRLRRRID